MANRYWVGGTANWDGTAGTKWSDTSGGAGGFSVPTTADDVFFSAASGGTVTIASGNTGAKSINCTGFTGTIAGSTAINVAGSITLSAEMTYTYTGLITITGTGTLTTAGKELSDLTIDGTGIVVTLGDALNLTINYMTVTRGTFDTSVNNYSVTAGRFRSSNTNTRTINFNASTITMNQAQPIDFTIPTNLTFNAGTSQINSSVSAVGFSGGGQTFYNVSFTSSFSAGIKTITGTNTFNNLTFATTFSGMFPIEFSDNQTINGTLTVTSTASNRRGFFRSDVLGTPRTLTAAAIVANNCDFRDITIAGAASPISPTYGGNCGGNTNITFPAAKTVYRVGNSTTWAGVSSWSLTSGGTGSDNNYPLAQDTAIINNATAASSLAFDPFVNLGNIDLSARTTALTLNHDEFVGTNIYGSYTLGSGVTESGINTLIFLGPNNQVITTAGKTITFPINITKSSGSVDLGDTFLSTNTLTLVSGTLDAKTYNLTCTTFASTGTSTRTITMGSGLWTMSGTSTVWNISGTGITFNKGTANILLSNTTSTARTFAGNGLTYNKLTIGGTTGTSALTITGTNTFSELASTKTVAHTVIFPNATTTVFSWTIRGTSGNVVTIQQTGASGTWAITKTGGGVVDADFLNVINSAATPSTSTWYAGNNSTNSGGNTGWIFGAAPAPTTGAGVLLASGLTIASGVTCSA